MKYYITIEQPGVDWENTPQMSFTLDGSDWGFLPDQAVDIAIAVSEMFKATVRLCKSEGYDNQGYYYYYK